MSLPLVVKIMVFMAAIVVVIVVVPFAIVALRNIWMTPHYLRRFIHTVIVGGAASLALIGMYVLAFFF